MGKKPTKTMVCELLKNGKVKIKGLKGKDGNIFDAYLMLIKNENENKDKYPYKWKMQITK
ncbi:topoisomerase C-terminal repeat-containing protein [Clostridium ljungdahlii]